MTPAPGGRALQVTWSRMTAIAVTIAGSDSGGGAGIQGDLKTFSALGVYGASVLTALTAQNTRGVSAVHAVPAAFIQAQIDAVFSDLAVRAVKIGMVPQPGVVAAIAAGLDRHAPTPVVVDPVMVATSGAPLIGAAAVAAMRRLLLPRALLITPNLAEAAVLVGGPPARNEAEMQAQAECILALGPKAVLVKGGHGAGADSIDILVAGSGAVRFAAPRLARGHTHGTGCALSAAIAAFLALGAPLHEAVAAAKDYVHAAIAAADQLGVGSGRGPVHHFHHAWPRR